MRTSLLGVLPLVLLAGCGIKRGTDCEVVKDPDEQADIEQRVREGMAEIGGDAWADREIDFSLRHTAITFTRCQEFDEMKSEPGIETEYGVSVGEVSRYRLYRGERGFQLR